MSSHHEKKGNPPGVPIQSFAVAGGPSSSKRADRLPKTDAFYKGLYTCNGGFRTSKTSRFMAQSLM